MFSKIFQSFWPNGGSKNHRINKKRHLEEDDESPTKKRPKPQLMESDNGSSHSYSKVASWVSSRKKSFCDNYYIRKVAQSPTLLMNHLTKTYSTNPQRGNRGYAGNHGDTDTRQVQMGADVRQVYHQHIRTERNPDVRFSNDLLSMQVHSTPLAVSSPPPTGYSFSETNFDLNRPDIFSFQTSPISGPSGADFKFQGHPTGGGGGSGPPGARYQDQGFVPVQHLNRRPPIHQSRDDSVSYNRGPVSHASVYDKTFSSPARPRRRATYQRNKAKMATRETIRLDERKRYAELLQQFTTTPLPGTAFGSTHIRKSSKAPFYVNARSSETVLGTTVSNIGPQHVTSDRTLRSDDSKVTVSPNKSRSPTCVAYNRRKPSLEEPDAEQTLNASSSLPRSTRSANKQPITIDLTNAAASADEASNHSRVGRVSISDSPEIIEIESSDSSRPRSPAKPEFHSRLLDAKLLNRSLQDKKLSLDRSTLEKKKLSNSLQESKYLDDDWFENFRNKYSQENRRSERLSKELEITTKYHKEQREEWDRDLERRVRFRLRLSEKEKGVAEDLYYEESEEEEEDATEDEFPALTEDQEAAVSSALRPHPADQILSEGFKLQIRRQDLQTLAGLHWLNDEVINFYMNMLVARGSEDNRPNVHAFNTFFYPKIMSGGQASVRRWTKKMDIFTMDYILVPVHLGMHWCLSVIDFTKKEIRYYDSMGGTNNACLQALKRYLMDESLDKRKTKYDVSDWNLINMDDIPQQMNGSDCGMFTCKFAEYVTRGANISFTQEHMPYFRRRMVYEILSKQLL